MSSSKCSFTCICGIFLPLNPSTSTVYARSAFYPSLRFTLSLQSAFYPWSTVCSLRFTPTDIIICLELTLSFLIGRKRTVNFRNQHPGCHLAADYTIIVSRTLKVTGNHVMYDHDAWFLRVIMSSSCALCCLPSVKKQKHDFQVCFVDRARHRKSSWRQGLTNTKRSTKVAKELFADYVKEKKLREPEEKKELAQTLKTCYVKARKKGFVQCIIPGGYCHIWAI